MIFLLSVNPHAALITCPAFSDQKNSPCIGMRFSPVGMKSSVLYLPGSQGTDYFFPAFAVDGSMYASAILRVSVAAWIASLTTSDGGPPR